MNKGILPRPDKCCGRQ